jgi:flavodoxin
MRFAKLAVAGMMLCCAGFVQAEEPAAAPDTAVVAGQKKILVVYYSRTGNTKRVAEDIARQLHADVEQLIDKKDRSGAGGYLGGGKDATRGTPAAIEPVQYDPAQYDLVVIGTPVWAWTMTPAVRTYIATHKAAFKEIALFTSAASSKPDRTVGRMEELAGKKARASVGFFDREYSEKKRAVYEEKLKAFVAHLR